ncbi:substrate-binding periplasmic protein [Inhella gelatinilytica]|uniref:Transporter substrate-binding domain-containing protein n=1 Tax=Inhella gelatinilytica TaxID=2795030 RepID=A0A931NAX2_9BURK|nr:transporter substrate-binding domain-containing protein [Inhella gelatinilytica]MBH9552948.1 transporter substrate-binding domain-containing protein [Inhella gelatinilytica]
MLWRASLVVLMLAFGVPAQALTLRWCLNEVASPPWRLGANDRPRLGDKGPTARGLEYDFLRLLAQRLGWEFEWVQRPWRRCLLELQRGEHDALMGMSYLPEREALYRYPMRDGQPNESLAYHTFGYALYLRTGQRSPWDGQRWSLAPGVALAVPQGYSIAAVLRQQQVAVDDSHRSTEDALAALVDGRVLAAALPVEEVEGVFVRQPSWRAQLQRAEPLLQKRAYFIVLSPAFADSNPELAQRVWRESAAVRQSPVFLKALAAQRSER